MMPCTEPQMLGVVPIVVNAGAALFPAILAGIVSLLAVLVRPSQWGRVARQRPYVPVLLVLIIGALAAWYILMPAKTTTRATRGGSVAMETSNGVAVDWTAIAMEYIRDQSRQPSTGGAASNTTTQPDQPSRSLPPLNATHAFVYRRDYQRSGYGGGQTPANLQELWRWSNPDDKFAMYCASVAVDPTAQWVYGASATISPPDSFGAVVCLDATTGVPRWPAVLEIPTETGATRPLKGIFSSPALSADGKSLLVGEGLHDDRDSALLCFNADTGKLRWRVQTPLHLESSPSIEGDVVIIGAGAVERASDNKVAPGDNPGFLLAVRIRDGKELWRFPVNDPESSSAFLDGVVYVGSGVNGNEVLALRSGGDDELKAAGLQRVIWRTKMPYPALGAITVADSVILTGCGDGNFVRPGPNGTVVALDRNTGEILWQTTSEVTKASVLSPVAVRGDMAVVGVGNGEVIALDLAKNGSLLWRRTISDTAPVNAGCAIGEDCVYALSADGWLSILDANDGTLRERHYINDPARPGELNLSVSGPIVINGRVFVGSETGGLRALAEVKQ